MCHESKGKNVYVPVRDGHARLTRHNQLIHDAMKTDITLHNHLLIYVNVSNADHRY